MLISLLSVLIFCVKSLFSADLNFFLPVSYKHAIIYPWNNLEINSRLFVSNASECQKRCQARVRCGYFTFYPHRNTSDNCMLKKQMSLPTCRLDNDPPAISGARFSRDEGNNFEDILEYVKRTKDHCLCLKFHKFCPGTIFEIHNDTYSTKVCYNFCLDDPRCLYYLADGNNCYLYSEIHEEFCRRQEKSIFGSVSCYEKDKNELLLISRMYNSSFANFYSSPLLLSLVIIEGLVIFYIVFVNYTNTSGGKRYLKAPEAINGILEITQSFAIYSGLIYQINFLSKRMNASEVPLIANIAKVLVHITVNSTSILRVFYINYDRKYDKKDTLLIILSVIFGAHIFMITNFVKSLSFQSTDFYFFLSAIKGIILLILSIIIRYYLPPYPKNAFYIVPIVIESVYIISNVLNSGFVIWERMKNDKLMNYSKSVMEENKKDIVLP